ncbi:hypothetical protein BJ742DRAFT_485418 [Cladochytrium replicatum]|nr:hypothetical protein BJ742DRAFT_485418 [Cladochytrium replicatum]
MGGLTSRPRTALIDFFVKHKEQDFINLVRLFHTYIDTHFVTSGITTVGGTTQGSSASVPIGRPDEALLGAVKALGLLYQANLRAAGRVPISQFYSETLSRRLNFKEEYKIWKRSFADSSEGSSIGISKHVNSEQSQADISFFDFPFLFEPVAKTRILHIDAMVQMSAEYEEAFVHQALVIHAARFLYDSPSVTQLGESLKTALNPYLVLSVRRHRLVDDVLDQLSRATTRELKKPLKVRFVGGGEDGVDQGGVQKEFFQVIINQLLDPAYGLFVVDDETRYVWINGASLEGEAIFECVGMVVGLALYNGVILGVDFPRIVYKKLLDEEIDLDDIKQAFPSLGRGLQQLLDWSDGDVSDIFMRTFEISYDVYGKVKTFPLVEGGEDILVTNEKRGEYVRLYIQHLCGESVKWQFEAFKRGFLKVCGGRAIKMCRPEELELLVCGTTTSVVDFTALETGAQYDDGYSPSHPVIRNFWSIVHTDFSLEQKRKLLSFVTASDRVPLRGLEGLTFVIQRNGPDTERLPTSLTCFGRLLLPEYSTREKLKERLVTAIENAKGFGLV